MNTLLRTRRRGRALAVQMLTSWDANPTEPALTMKRVAALSRASAATVGFAEKLARGAWDRLERIDACLDGAMEPYWRTNLGRVERGVLRVAVGELLSGAAPPAVVVSEALEVTRLYSGETAVPFIHGVLDTVAQQNRIPATAETKAKKPAAAKGIPASGPASEVPGDTPAELPAELPVERAAEPPSEPASSPKRNRAAKTRPEAAATPEEPSP